MRRSLTNGIVWVANGSPLPIHRIHHRGLTIEGYSRAAVQSYWRVPELDVGFDLGGHPPTFTRTSNWFISHGHLDHIAAIPMFAWRRARLGLQPGRVFLPDEHLGDARELLAAYAQLAGARLDCELVGLMPGDVVPLPSGHAVAAFRTRHTVRSLGFAVWAAPGASPAPPLLCYTGDTSPAGLDENPFLYDAMVLVTEMSFVEPRHRPDRVHKYGHLHLDDFLLRCERFRNELIIASHVTARSTPSQVERRISRTMPSSLQARLAVWM